MLVTLLMLVLGVCQTIFGNSFENQVGRFLNSQSFSGSILIAQDGKVILCKGYGFANLEHQILNQGDTVFRIASISKQFTSLAIMQLQEKGLLSVHDPLNRYLPGFPRGDEITIHHLLTHTSGLPEITDFPNLEELQRHPSTPHIVMSYFQELPLQFSPGSDCAYCNSGYIVLGAIIESVAGLPYESYMQTYIFEPLGLKATYVDDYQAIIPLRASGYSRQADGTLKHASFIDMSFPHAAGAIASSAYDLFTWNEALYNCALISKESLSALTTLQATNKTGSISYGYGLCIGPKNKYFEKISRPVIGHMGSIEGFRSALVYYPKSRTTIIILSNCQNADIRTLHTTLASIFFTFSWR